MNIIGQTDATKQPRYVGFSTFARLPMKMEVEGKVGTGVIGIPFDGGCTYRTGARFGPEAIRKASRLLRPYNPALDVYPFAKKQVVDMGDIAVTPFNNEKAVEQIYEGVKRELGRLEHAVFMGGDHTISYPILRCMTEKYDLKEGVTLIHFDSHLDTWDEYFEEKITHGTPFKRAFEEGLINRETSMHVGIRGSVNDSDDFKRDGEMGFKVIQCSEVVDPAVGIKGIVEKIKSRVKMTPCYLSIDIDVVDPAFAPGTGTPECGGFSSMEILSIIRGLQGINLIGGDVVEVAPCYDHGENTSLLAATLCYELICLINSRKRVIL